VDEERIRREPVANGSAGAASFTREAHEPPSSEKKPPIPVTFAIEKRS
jgi:hypothetical protein